MSTTSPENSSLSDQARRHLWMHFSRMGAYETHEVPVIVRGEGAYVWDQHGKRYLDGLAGLFTSQLGHGRTRAGRGGRQAGRDAGLLPAVDLRPPPRHRAGRAGGELRARRPQPGLLHHRRVRGGRVGLEAGPPVLPHARAAADAPRSSAATSPTTARPWARSPSPASPTCRPRSSRSCPGPSRCRTRTSTGPTCFADDEVAFGRWAADEIERAIEREGPDTVAAVFLEPVQNAGGCFPPPPGLLRAASARSATATACCSSPTRSSAPSAAWATGSAPCATGTSPTSSRWPRASPRATRRSGP